MLLSVGKFSHYIPELKLNPSIKEAHTDIMYVTFVDRSMEINRHPNPECSGLEMHLMSTT